jgi:hypothetical protein
MLHALGGLRKGYIILADTPERKKKLGRCRRRGKGNTRKDISNVVCGVE